MDYVTNNLAESFNNWIKAEKAKHIDDLMDTIRQKLLIKWNTRKKGGQKVCGKDSTSCYCNTPSVTSLFSTAI